MFFQYSPPSFSGKGPKLARFIPFALYIHKLDVINFPGFWDKYGQTILKELDSMANVLGEYYASRKTLGQAFSMLKEKTVIVLGKDSDDISLATLISVSNYIAGRGYEPVLIKQMAEVPQWSNEEKVRAWGMAARFCVIVDIEPSGHIAEYVYLKQQRIILAVIRPQGGRSTYMIWDDQYESTHVKIFEFTLSPVEVLDAVISWAEGVTQDRTGRYNEIYPWRQGKKQ